MTGANTTTGFTTLENTELYYELAGQGVPLVLVHAAVADHTMWDRQVEAFAKNYHVIRYDMRGYGNSKAATQAFSHHEDLHSLLTFLKLDKAHLLGASGGSATIIDFALQYPEKVLSLNLISPAVSGYEVEGPPPKRLLNLFAALEQGNWELATELAAQIWVDGPKRTPQRVNQAVRSHFKTMGRTALNNMNPAVIQSSPLNPSALERLGELEIPTQIIVGNLDDDSIADIAERLAKDIKEAQKVVIDDVTHMLNMEKPKIFNQKTLMFLRGIS